MRAFTIVGRNYLAHARTLGVSMQRSNPDVPFSVVILDDDGTLDAADEPFDIIAPSEVFSEEEYGVLSSIYSVMELATAIKPRVLRHLLDASDGPVVYLDPDLWFFGSLAEVAAFASEHGIVLTPHATDPIHRDDTRPGETEILRSGVYNLGFVAVGQEARPFLDWWWERLERDCIVAPHDGIFVDQRWVDFAPGLFDHYILKDPAYNVAYWNLGERSLVWTGERYEVDGQPLVFIHFSGFDPHKEHVLSKHTMPNPRVLMSEQPALAQIAGEYAEEMLANGYDEVRRTPYALDELPNGVRMDRTMRYVYREGVLAGEDDDGVGMPPNPRLRAEDFVAWLADEDPDASDPRISRYLGGLWQVRPDLQRVFDLRDPNGVDGYLDWVATSGRYEEGTPGELVPSPGDSPDDSPAIEAVTPRHGVNVTGYLRAELGVGEAARTMAETVEVAGEDLAMLAYSGTLSRMEHNVGDVLEAGVDQPPYDINIVTINADSTVSFARDVGHEFFDHRYTVGMWAWEVEEFPVAWLPAFDLVDEVWMNSDYAATAVRRVATKPVYNMPLAVAVPDAAPLEKADLGLPDRFMFLFSFDFFSIFERKNPLALIEAFTHAFEPGEGPILYIKSINGDKRLEHLEELRAAAAEHPDVFVMDGYLPAEQKNRLMATCDAYVSLHRSEGFGITMAEAMALGKPTIATGYSGNLEFMTSDNSYLVEYEPSVVPPGCEPYPVGAVWADPSIENAAQIMRHVFENQEEAARVGERAREAMGEHSPKARARLLRRHLDRIRETEDTWSDRVGASAPPADLGAPYSFVVARNAVDSPVDNLWFEDSSNRLTQAVRTSALSVMRPALARERAVDEAFMDALLDVWRHVRAVEGNSAGSVAALRHEWEAGLRRSSAETRAIEGSIERSIHAVNSRLDELTARLEEITRGVTETSEGARRFRDDASAHLAELSRDVEMLQRRSGAIETAMDARPFMEDPSMFVRSSGVLGFDDGFVGDPYREFEDVFRGNEDFIRERQRVYLPLVAGQAPILDAGCGRGEFLDVLAEAGIEAVGVDLDSGMVARCQDKGHSVVFADVIEHLRTHDDRYGAVFSAQFIEHVPLDGLIDFMKLSVERLEPGGVFIAETVNPHSFPAFRTFWTDLTHRAPIFPEVALAYARAVGFASGEIMFPNGTGNVEDDLRTQGEYALVARVPG